MNLKRLASLLLTLTLLAGSAVACAKPAVPKISDSYRNYYEIFVRSFYDSNGDGFGDLPGVTQKLDYITQDLGADAIWLMPIMPSPTYHKYDVTDYFEIDPQYGTLADFDQLLAEARKRDVRVIIDLVLNHTSNLHPWFDTAVQALWQGEESPYIDYYRFTLENPGQGYNKITDKYYYECRFVAGMPDLNLDSSAVRDEIIKIAKFWLDRGVDGFRLDACTSYYTGNTTQNVEFLRWFNQEVKAIKADAYLIGEVWSDAGTIAEYYKSGIDSFFNFPYAQATGRLIPALNRQDGNGFAQGLADWQSLLLQNNDKAIDALFLSNHDNARSAGFLLRNLQKQKMAAAMYLLAPGNPFIYYGEELGMNGSGIDENKRLPMLWSTSDRTGIPQAPPNATQSVDGIAGVDQQRRDRASLLNHYRKILSIKAANPEIARGAATAIDVGLPGVAVLSITWQDNSVLVLHNLTPEKQVIAVADLGLSELIVADFVVSQATSGKPVINGGKLTLLPLSTTLLR
jgi:alpha-amylase